MIPSLVEHDGLDMVFADDPLGRNTADIVFGTAMNLKGSSREVLLSSGTKIRYDKLLIARRFPGEHHNRPAMAVPMAM